MIDLRFDKNHIWHPYTSMSKPLPTYPVSHARGVTLFLENGTQLIDGMASWWSAIHGYQVPELNLALESQLKKMAHVMFGGISHQPAVDLAKQLVSITPNGLDHVFFADSGSISVEVALKMALQFWYAQGKPRTKFLTVRGGYHGDSFGAMSVCDPEGGMHRMWTGILPQHYFADKPPAGFERPLEPGDLDSVAAFLEQDDVAAVILEPIVQGAGGMHFFAPEYIQVLADLCEAHNTLLIFDEIATGFGRTGALFAADHANITPDILCLGKGLTGGYMTLAATLCNQKVCEGISADGSGILMHGPTFMGNPLACSVANASIQLLLNSPWQDRVKAIERQLKEELEPARQSSKVADVRVLGAIGVIEMKEPVSMAEIQAKFVAMGVWIRPFGKLIYIMPPYIIKETELRQLTKAMIRVSKD